MKEDIDKQEELVSALWDFAHDLQTKEKTTVNVDTHTWMNLDAIEKAMERIAKNYGYKIIPVD